MDPVTERLKAHYARTFDEHGATARGVDWGRVEDVELRYRKMLAVIAHDPVPAAAPPSLLDVGCGYGGLLEYARAHGQPLRYNGLDVVPAAIEHARRALSDARFVCADVFEPIEGAPFDYVVSSGILTQKLATSIREMDAFAHRLIKRMFELSRRGIAFNVMSNQVNFMVENLYYRSPVELLAFCLAELGPKVLLDHAYPLYEYTVYAYRTS